MTRWNLDTGNDGCDEEGLAGTRDEVVADVMHHHDLREWPSHWTLEPAEIEQETRTMTHEDAMEICDAIQGLTREVQVLAAVLARVAATQSAKPLFMAEQILIDADKLRDQHHSI